MIEKIKIQNFQSHKDTAIELDKGVNIIVGSSDSGKSAILRALRWVFYNKPRGDFFRSWWGGDTKIDVEFTDFIVSKLKTNTETIYYLENKINNKTLEFRAFGNDVPEEIIKAINLSEINLQLQLDKPFLISDTPGEVASHFNRMAKLEKIDIGLKNIQTKIRSTEQTLSFEKNQLKETKEKFQQYSYIDKLEEEVVDLEVLQKESNDKEAKKNKINEITTHIIDTQFHIDNNFKYLSAENPINEIIEKQKEKEEKNKRISSLQNLTRNIQELQDTIDNLSFLVICESSINSIIKQKEILSDKEKQEKTLKNIINTLEDSNDNVIRYQNLLDKLQKEYKQNMPNTCPLCQTILSE